MSSSDLIRWGGPAAMLGGLLSVVFAFVGEDSWAHVPLDAARYAFLMVGIVGIYLYLHRSEGFGMLGTVGFYVCVFVFALVAILDLGIIVNEGVEQTYISLGPVRGPMLLLGLLLFGASLVRAGGLPRGGVAAYRRRTDQCGGHSRDDCLWRHAGGLGLHRAHGAFRAGMGMARVRPVVRRWGLIRAALTSKVDFLGRMVLTPILPPASGSPARRAAPRRCVRKFVGFSDIT